MEQFMNKVNGNSDLREKYLAVIAKHENTRNRDALAAELSEFARSEGFDIAPKEMLSAFAPKGEIGEQELENVSGGGSGAALCLYSSDTLRSKITVRSVDGGYEGRCPSVIGLGCNWVLCRCWGTSHCKDGWHKCNEDGSYIIGHGWTI